MADTVFVCNNDEVYAFKRDKAFNEALELTNIYDTDASYANGNIQKVFQLSDNSEKM